MNRLYWNIRRMLSNVRYRVRKKLGLPRDVDFDYVDLVFENCNSVRIPSHMVEYLAIDDIRKSVFTNCSQQFIEENYCTKFRIQIKNEALQIKTNFEKMCSTDLISTFDRHINYYRDITHVAIKKKHKKELYISVPYETESHLHDTNLLQAVELVDGAIIISCVESEHKGTA